jgi:hypothetical protein
MKTRDILSMFVPIFGASMAATATFAGSIMFHPERAAIGGNGCPQDATRLSVDEFGDLLIEHNAMSISLAPSGGNPALAARKACAIRVPVTVASGFYVKSIEQRLTYAVSKSAGSEARLATRTSLSGINLNPFTVVLPQGDEMHSDFMIDSRRDTLSRPDQRASFCQPDRSEDQMLQINVAITAQRDSASEEIVIAAHGGYIGEGFEIELAPCP